MSSTLVPDLDELDIEFDRSHAYLRSITPEQLTYQIASAVLLCNYLKVLPG